MSISELRWFMEKEDQKRQIGFYYYFHVAIVNLVEHVRSVECSSNAIEFATFK